MAKIKLNLDDIVSQGRVINVELNAIIEKAVAKRIPLVEFISEKGNAELKKRVLLFLAQPHIKQLYHRIEKDDKNSNHILVHFRLRSNRKRIGIYGHPAKMNK